MARIVWEDRIVERPRTYEKIENPDGTITLTPSPGQVIQEGTPVNAEHMNNIEQGIEDTQARVDTVQQDLVTHKAESMPHQFIDNGKTYRWGFRTKNGVAQFIYEEVV